MTKTKGNKGIQIIMKEIKLLAEDILIYVKSAEESTKIHMRTNKYI